MDSAHQNMVLKIIELNVNSLYRRPRRHNMLSFLQEHKPDAVLVSETHLRPTSRISFLNYQFIRRDAISDDSAKSGTGILIKSSIKHKILNTRSWGLISLESTAAQIITDGAPITLISVYRHHRNRSTTALINDLDKLTAVIAPLGPYIIGGDFNAHHTSWRNTSNCPFGNHLFAWYQSNRLTHGIRLLNSHDPTFVNSIAQSYIDLFIVSDNLEVVPSPTHGDELDVLDYPSDHHAVQLIIRPSNVPAAQQAQTLLDYNNTDWRIFRDTVDTGCATIPIISNRNMSPEEIDTAVSDLTSLIANTIHNQVPVKTIKNTTLLNLPQSILDIISYKKTLRRRWQRHHYDPNDHHLISEIRCTDKLITDQLRIIYEDHWVRSLSAIQTDHRVFNHINKYSARKKKKPITHLSHNGNLFEDDSEIANLLGSHFEQVHHRNLHLGDANLTTSINNNIRTEFRQNIPKVIFSESHPANPSNGLNPDLHLTSIDNLRSIIKSRNNKKSSGNDNISNYVLRKLGTRFTTLLATILNQSYNIHHFPTQWKSAQIIAIQKHGKPADNVDSYRPISLLPCLSKIYECAIKDKLSDQCSALNIIPPDQFGFRHHCSTTHPLVILQNDIVAALHKKTPTIAISLDIAKAFDTTWIEGLIHKLANIYNFDRHLCRVLYNYMTDRTFTVQVNNASSILYNVIAGVPQGGVLSALMFNLFIADMPLPPANLNEIKRLQYADDTLIYLSIRNISLGTERLNNYIATLLQYQTQWKIQCSHSKCELIVFKGPSRMHTPTIVRECKNVSITVGTQTLLQKKTLKYLGVTFSHDAKHIKHIDETIRKATNAIHAIRPIIYGAKGASIKVRKLCYKQLVRPIITYGFPCWSSISSHQMERIRILERKCLRHCTRTTRARGCFLYLSNSMLYTKANIDPIDHVLVKQACRFFRRIDPIETPIMADCLPGDIESVLRSLNDEYHLPCRIWELENSDNLFNNGLLTFYHRRHNPSLGRTDLVYLGK